MSIESQTKAHNNGETIENLICSLYPGADFSCNRIVDLYLDGKPVEIKSCQKYVTDNNNSGSKRSGRFVFNGIQHQELIENGGEYIFIVHEELKPLLVLRASASSLNFLPWDGIKSTCWKTVINTIICELKS